MQTDKAESHSFSQKSLRDLVCTSHVVRATVRAFFLLTDLPMIWRCWQVALLWDVCGNNKLVWQTHTCMHMRHGVTNWDSQWQCGILSTLIMQSLWQLQKSNSSHCLPPPFLLSSSLPHSEFLSIFPPSLTHHPPIHLRWLHFPPHCNSQKTEHELESRQQEEQSCWFWLATFKETEVVVCVNDVCLAASTVNAGSSGLLAAGVQFSYHFVVSDKDMECANIWTVKRLSQPKKGILWCHSSLLSPWQMRTGGDTGACSHSRDTYREQSQRLAETERYHNSCHQLPRHCMAIEICIAWYAYVGNCLFQFYMTLILLSVCYRMEQDGLPEHDHLQMAAFVHTEMSNENLDWTKKNKKTSIWMKRRNILCSGAIQIILLSGRASNTTNVF